MKNYRIIYSFLHLYRRSQAWLKTHRGIKYFWLISMCLIVQVLLQLIPHQAPELKVLFLLGGAGLYFFLETTLFGGLEFDLAHGQMSLSALLGCGIFYIRRTLIVSVVLACGVGTFVGAATLMGTEITTIIFFSFLLSLGVIFFMGSLYAVPMLISDNSRPEDAIIKSFKIARESLGISCLLTLLLLAVLALGAGALWWGSKLDSPWASLIPLAGNILVASLVLQLRLICFFAAYSKRRIKRGSGPTSYSLKIPL